MLERHFRSAVASAAVVFLCAVGAACGVRPTFRNRGTKRPPPLSPSRRPDQSGGGLFARLHAKKCGGGLLGGHHGGCGGGLFSGHKKKCGGGLFAKQMPTQMFNGYEEEVASLYEGMDLIEFH